MIIIKNKLIPIGNYDAMALWPFIFSKGELKEYVKRHESIHLKQQLELFIIGFLILYLLMFLWQLLKFKNWDIAYKAIPFEREAYTNQYNKDYLGSRKLYAWRRYL